MIRRAMLVFLLPGFWCGGCATRVIPPAVHGEAATVYLSDYGRHSSLLLPARGGYNEYAFGDWEFFARGDTRWWVGLRALLHSPQATLGKRFIAAPDGIVTAKTIDAQRLMSFQAPRPRIEALEMSLTAAFARAHADPLYSDYSKLYHVRNAEPYWLLHNCNHVTARWLRQLGCDVRGTCITSKFYLQQP
jgi:hypothetical protein